MLYIISPTSDDMMHYGVDHLHSKTGRGSGRYAWGSGKNPRAGRQTYGSIYTPTKKSRNTSGAVRTKPKIDNGSGTTPNGTKSKGDPRGVTPTGKFNTRANMYVVNKRYKDMDNCSLCTFAMIAREKGYDVEAGGSLEKDDGRYNNEIFSWYKNAEPSGFVDTNYFFTPTCPYEEKAHLNDTYEKFMLRNVEDGAYGNLNVLFVYRDGLDFYCGHSVFFKREGDKIMIYDSQIPIAMPYQEYMATIQKEVNGTDDIVGIPESFVDCTNATLDMEGNHEAREIVTPDYNYSPADRDAAEREAKRVKSNYDPPYSTEKIAYNPPYETSAPKKIAQKTLHTINKAAEKVKDTAVSTAKKASNKLSSAINKVKKAVIK